MYLTKYGMPKDEQCSYISGSRRPHVSSMPRYEDTFGYEQN